MNPPPLDCELEETVIAWNNAVSAVEDLTKVAETHRAMVILDKVYKPSSLRKTLLIGPTNHILPLHGLENRIRKRIIPPS